MLRSVIIGLAVATLLHVGSQAVVPASGVAMTAQRIDWAKAQATAMARLVHDGYTLLVR